MINVLADRYLYNLQSFVPPDVNVHFYDPSEGFPSELNEAQAMLIRTVSTVNKKTLPDIPPTLQFVGTASAGNDHVDIDYLAENGITFSDAAGCNARSVAEYIATALLLWSEDHTITLSDLSVAIVGVGHVGTQVKNLLNRLDIPCKTYDPPRETRDPGFQSAALEDVLKCDILTLHTPLTTKGPFSTHHWLDSEKLRNRQFKLIINTARGGVIDEEALLNAKTKNKIDTIIIDTWENEPNFSLATARNSFIMTPHIAGYSEQAKNNATRMVVNAMLDHFGMSRVEMPNEQDPRVLEKDITAFDTFSSLLTELHPIRKYEAELKKIVRQNPEERGTFFNKLRAEYPFRQEFAQTYLPPSYFERFPILEKLDFSELE